MRINKYLRSANRFLKSKKKTTFIICENSIIKNLGLIHRNAGGGIRTHDPKGERLSRLNLKVYYKQNKKTFKEWLFKRIDKKTAETYLYYLDKYLGNVYSSKDMQELLINIESGRNWFVKAVRNLLNFAEERDDFTLEYLTKMRRVLKVQKTGVREVFITNEEIIEAYKHIKDCVKAIFKLMVYSGVRLSQIYRILGDLDHSKFVIKNKITRYPIAEISKGEKKGFWVYMPRDFINELENVELPYSYNKLQKMVRFGRVCPNTIRKWNYNFLILNEVPESVADFIQGRSSVTVGSAHYLNKTKHADEWYSKIVDKFPIR